MAVFNKTQDQQRMLHGVATPTAISHQIDGVTFSLQRDSSLTKDSSNEP